MGNNIVKLKKKKELGILSGWNFASSKVTGRRKEQQDEFKNTKDFFAIFDGHSGKKCSGFLRDNFLEYCQSWTSDKEIIDSFLKIDHYMKENKFNDGSCAIMVKIVEMKTYASSLTGLNDYGIICANVGDSRCIFWNGEKVIEFSKDQKPYNPNEKKRIEDAGYYVFDGRVSGNLAVSRAFGDFLFKGKEEKPQTKQAVIVVPEIKRFKLSKKETCKRFIVLASDGVWDVMNNEEVCNFINHRLKEQEDKVGYLKNRLERMKEVHMNYMDEREESGEEENVFEFEVEEDFYAHEGLSMICDELIHECVISRKSNDNTTVTIILFD
jgi:serine/threonine protein phosphatase PrpC